MTDKSYHLLSDHEAATLFGLHDEHLKLIEQAFGVKVTARGLDLAFSGSEAAVRQASRLFDQLLDIIRMGRYLRREEVVYAIQALREHSDLDLHTIYLDKIPVLSKRQFITPKTAGQKAYVDAIRKYDIVFAIGPAGTGKCVAGSTLVLTDRGLVPIRTLAEGVALDQYAAIQLRIAGLDGIERASHVYNGGRSPTKRIRTRLGFEIEVTPEHPLLELGVAGEVHWTPARQLRVGSVVAIQRGQRLFGNQTAVEFQYQPNGPTDHSKPVRLAHLDGELAYTLGILTGDGCLTFKNRVIVSSADPEILACFARLADRFGLHVFRNGRGRPYDRIIASSQLYQLLLHLGLSDCPAATKRVPVSILSAPQPFVVAFLQGLFDADGTVNQRDGYPQLSSVSKTLVDEVQLLLLNLGILANKRPRWTWYRDQRRLSYQLEMTGSDADRFYETVGFRLPRKQLLQWPRVRNTNIDVIPHIYQVIRSAIAAGTFPREVHHGALDDYKRGRRQPGYKALGNIVGLLERGASPTEASATLATLHRHHFFWAQIVEIADGEADVYDLTVPGTRAFCANGFMNHNTYLAMAMAVAALKDQEVSRIILTRPAVEAGESLGFLPGDLTAKVSPYLRPLYDALYDMMDVDRIQRFIERGIIEVAPLAYMRGRTLNDSFVILDEAQNSTPEQMKMFLTRLGFDSKTVITGDITQSDLPKGQASGLVQAREILQGIEGIAFVEFSGSDVVRHELVQQIIRAYQRRGENARGAQ